MIVLDTNLLSELMKAAPDELVWSWFQAQLREDLHTTAITVAEIHSGIQRMPNGRRREQVRKTADGMFAAVTDEVLSFTAEAAMAYPVVLDRRTRAGLPIQPLDAQIAAICLVEEATLATRNTKDFVETGVELVNPWE
ncbi:type II toxin-antitoxin system VapC family toxin [Kribbella catacumbae]|uniref:type II toxin-antitoxin system VapC family toxin n=1 Tax=Kribbella catacumbae TaxID=460086 RepID=UPI000371B8B3|nr:type II toxin-antitoxin system VapC family toxin [Kribbella catacumbae]